MTELPTGIDIDTTGKEIFSEPFLRTLHLPALHLICLRWKGYAPTPDYKRGLENALEFVLENEVYHWLADLREMGVILMADERWTNTEWFPQLAKSGLKRMAILRSVDYFNAMSVDRIMNASADVVGFEVSFFSEEAEAIAWLLADATGH